MKDYYNGMCKHCSRHFAWIKSKRNWCYWCDPKGSQGVLIIKTSVKKTTKGKSHG